MQKTQSPGNVNGRRDGTPGEREGRRLKKYTDEKGKVCPEQLGDLPPGKVVNKGYVGGINRSVVDWVGH